MRWTCNCRETQSWRMRGLISWPGAGRSLIHRFDGRVRLARWLWRERA